MTLTYTGREPHPTLATLPPEAEERVKQLDKPEVAEAVRQFYEKRAQIMFLEKHDPLRYGFVPPVWLKAEEQIEAVRMDLPDGGVAVLLVLGGNRGAKTRYALWKAVKLAVTKAGARIWILHSTQANSRANHQNLVFEMLPPEWRPDTTGKHRQGRTTKIVYSDAGGFTNDVVVLPNGSTIWFKFYGANVKTLEGSEIDLAVSDELIEPDWIEAITFRLLNRNGTHVITFTPVEGYSATVKMFLDGAVTLEEVEAELLPIYDRKGEVTGHEKVPRVQKSGRKNARIIYFHNKDNPYGNYPAMKSECVGRDRASVLMRAYGVPTKREGSQLNFNSAVHVIPEKDFKDLVERYPKGTRYHLVDPCSGRNWFMLWFFCPYPGKAIIYREWPSHGHPGAYIEGIGDPGPWATLVSSNPRREGTKPPQDGERGPAQEPFKFSLSRYKKEVDERESGESIFERYIDCRAGNSPREDAEHVTTLIQQMDDVGLIFCPMVGEKKILGVNDGSIDMINSALYYDKSCNIGEYSAEMARVNEPMLQIVETCPNTIFSFENWTGQDGLHGACKDPIDCARGYYLTELGYVGRENSRRRNGSAGY